MSEERTLLASFREAGRESERLVSDASDRRKLLRAPLDGWVEIAADGRRARNALLDISVGGLGIGRTTRLLMPGTRVVSEFPLPEY